MATEIERYFPDATAEQLKDGAYACRMVAESGGNDDDWQAPQAMQARQLTRELGWSWDFSTWSHAAGILDQEARLADEEEPD